MMNDERTPSRLKAIIAQAALGAVQGGPTGAAAGAARGVLSLLLAPLVTLLILTLLIFIAIPNMLFGFATASDEKVAAMTEKAAIMQSAYEVIDTATQERIQEIIQLASENEEYNELEVNTFMDNTNLYWFIAICSVAHRQDLYAMDESSVRSLVVTKIFWSSSVRVESNEDGEKRILVIDIQDFDPQRLMDKLSFTNEERNWAAVLYSTMADTQYQDTSGYGEGIDLSEFVLTDVATPVVYYNQFDRRWCNHLYGKSGTIGEEGCGPTAVAIVVASLINNRIDPVDVAKWSAGNGHRCEGNGSYHSLIPAACAHYGLEVEGIGLDKKALVTALQDGKLVIALMSKGHFTNGGHFIVLRGMTESGEVLVADPASTYRSNQTWALGIVTGEARRDAAAGGPFWVVS